MMIKTASAWATATLINYLCPFLVVAVPILGFGETLPEATVGALIGATAIWIWSRPRLVDGAASASVGLLMTLVFHEKQFPLVSQILFGGEPLTVLQNGFLWGGVGYMALGAAINAVRKRLEKP